MPTLHERAEAIAEQYLAQVSPTYHGRLAELTEPDKVLLILKCVGKGMSLTRSADRACLSRRTLQRWKELGEAEPESAYGTFVTAVKEAEADFIERQHTKLEEAAEDDSRNWAARMTLLERRFPEEYGRRQEDSNVPRVVVQIGVKDSDVQISVSQDQVAVASLSPTPNVQLGQISTGQVVERDTNSV